MRSQINRLPAQNARGFTGSALDRSKPLSFRLDGRLITGFAGDTVLSAVLASGIDTLGDHRSHPIGLTLGNAPAIQVVGRNTPVPMAQAKAVDGAELTTVSKQGLEPFTRFLQPRRTLRVSLDAPGVFDKPWRAIEGAVQAAGDLVVIGAGVAGLSAALAGARSGLSVTLVEMHHQLGGNSGLFGTQDGEDTPGESMTRLASEARSSPSITVLTGAEAFALRHGRVRVHQVSNAFESHVLDLDAPRIIIATGALERLPVFAGNRLPGIVGSLEAYELAARYAVWPGKNAAFATVSSPAYRIATLARDAGIEVGRILDDRAAPASRFIEFSKAYGIVQAPGTKPQAATVANRRLSISTHSAGGSLLETDRLVVCGGWQPDLTLWHIAGGSSRWRSDLHRLEAEGLLDGIALAGSAAGYLTRRGCIQSGADALDQLLGRARKPVEDLLIDPLYETPDGPCPVSEMADGAPAYLDSGAQLLIRPQAPRRHWFGLNRKKEKIGPLALSEAPQPLAISEVAAGVDLGLIPPAAAGVVAQERVALVPLAAPTVETPKPLPQRTPDHVPGYLIGRFGPEARVVQLKLDQPRRLEPGALLYRSADTEQPLMALGVVLRQNDAATLALVAEPAARSGEVLSLRDHDRAIPVRIAEYSAA